LYEIIGLLKNVIGDLISQFLFSNEADEHSNFSYELLSDDPMGLVKLHKHRTITILSAIRDSKQIHQKVLHGLESNIDILNDMYSELEQITTMLGQFGVTCVTVNQICIDFVKFKEESRKKHLLDKQKLEQSEKSLEELSNISEAKTEEIKALQQQIQFIESSIEHMQVSSDKEKNSLIDIYQSEMKTTIDKLNSELTVLKEKLEAERNSLVEGHQSEVNTLLEKMNSERASFSISIQNLEQRIEALQEELEEIQKLKIAQQGTDTIELGRLQEQLSQLNQQLSAKSERAIELELELSLHASRMETMTASYTLSVESLKLEIQKLHNLPIPIPCVNDYDAIQDVTQPVTDFMSDISEGYFNTLEYTVTNDVDRYLTSIEIEKQKQYQKEILIPQITELQTQNGKLLSELSLCKYELCSLEWRYHDLLQMKAIPDVLVISKRTIVHDITSSSDIIIDACFE
jgi:hypothetical protein